MRERSLTAIRSRSQSPSGRSLHVRLRSLAKSVTPSPALSQRKMKKRFSLNPLEESDLIFSRRPFRRLAHRLSSDASEVRCEAAGIELIDRLSPRLPAAKPNRHPKFRV
jgi:hypothetical protein